MKGKIYKGKKKVFESGMTVEKTKELEKGYVLCWFDDVRLEASSIFYCHFMKSEIQH